MLWRKDSYVLYVGQQGDGLPLPVLSTEQEQKLNAPSY